MTTKNIVIDTDSYKGTMAPQYLPGTQYVYSYIMARKGGVFDETMFFGLQPILKTLTKRVTKKMVDEAEIIWKANGLKLQREPFTDEAGQLVNGWNYIVNELKGKLPLEIRAVAEGLVIPTANVLATCVNTDPTLRWLTTWVETSMLRVWYPITVGTLSWELKEEIKDWLIKSGDIGGLLFKLHDFGSRGVSSHESAEIGSAAHLMNFYGTDTLVALPYLIEHYNADPEKDILGVSIPASEHSTMTSWGREREADAYKNMIDKFGAKGAIFSVVSDSYNIFKATDEIWGQKLKTSVIDSGATLVIRPDSGDPIEVLREMLRTLEKNFGVIKNNKGFKVLNSVRIIWGDGIDRLAISSILSYVVGFLGYSADNFAFGMGGGLLQKVNRDDLKFAMKCSAIGVQENNELVWKDVYKDPITDHGKKSIFGRVSLYKGADGKYFSGVAEGKDELVTVFKNGKITKRYTMNEVRANTGK